MHTTTDSPTCPRTHADANRLRVRWAAIGAAIAVTLGAGTIATVDAVTSSGERAVYTAITPCRLIDTRPGDINVGPKNTPLGPGTTETITARGAQGQCTAAQLPNDAVALALNATALNATADGFLTFWPDGPRPLAASLNPSPGQPPAPNAVTTDLATDGTFRIYNENGTVDLVLDVIGYYTDHNHDDRYYTKTELDSLLAAKADATRVNTLQSTTDANSTGIAALDAAQPFAVTARNDSEDITSSREVVVFVDVTAPVAGQITVNSTTTAFELDPGGGVRCSITTESFLDGSYAQQWESAGDDGGIGQLGATRTFDIAAGATARYNLVCHNLVSPGSTLQDSTLTAIFTPAP